MAEIYNQVSNTLITGTAYGDSITNGGSRVTINALGGNDTIRSGLVDSVSIYGGDGDDYIESSGSNVTISGGAGSDKIDNYGDTVLIDGGAGNDYIYNEGDNVLVTYSNGDGNDFIPGFKANSTLSITGAAYTSIQSGNDIVLGVGTGSITLSGAASLSTVNIIGTLSGGGSTDSGTLQGTSGNDSLEIVHEEISWAGGIRQTIYSALYGLAGDDTLENVNEIYTDDGYTDYKNNVIMDGGTGNDLINNYGANSKLTGGDGNDYIVNRGDNVSISGGAGNDTISNDGDNVSINAGDGDNSIDNSGTNVTLDALGNGNDSVYNTGNGLTINTGAGNNHVYNSGATLSITAGDGNDDIINDGSNVTINAGAGNNSIIAGGSNAIINTGAGNDSVNNNSNNSSISTGDGSDTIRNYGDNSSISTGAGNDSIHDSSDNSSISTGAGNDSIDVIGDNVTISGGAGDDYIRNIRGEGDNILIQYASGDGNDSITGFNATSTISIDGAAYTSVQSGSDIVLGVNSSSITLVDAADLSTVNIIGTLSGGSDTQETALNINNTISNTLITGTAYADSITNSGDGVTINALASGDTIINTGASVSISGGAGKDSIRNYGTKGTISAGDGDDYIDNTFLADSVAIDAGAGDDMIYAASSYLTINAGTGDDSIYVQATSSGTTQGGLRNSILGGAGADTIENEGKQTTIDGGAGSDYIDNTELAGNNVIRGGAGADFIYNSAASVTIDAGEDNDYIDNFEGNVTISAGAGADTVYNSYGSSVSISGGDGNDSIHNAPHSDNATITAGAGADTIINRSDSALIDGGAGNDRIQNGDSDDYSPYGVNSTISGGAGSDTISNIRASVSIGGGADNDSIRNTASNVTITGGAGADTVYNVGSNVLIQYTSGDGNDTINDLSTTSTLSIAGAAYTSVQSGDDLIIGVGTGSITLVDAASLSTVNIIGTLSGSSTPADTGVTVNNTTSNTVINGSAYNDTITNRASNVTINAQGGNDIITNNYTTSPDNVLINGGAGSDTIENAGDNSTVLGGAGNDTIENTGDTVRIDAGAGNDSVYSHCEDVTISGAGGNDTIVIGGDNHLVNYASGDGNDLIQGFRANSTISIGGAAYTSLVSGNDLIIGVGTGSITLEGAASLSTVNIIGTLDGGGEGVTLNNTVDATMITGTAYADSIVNSGDDVTIQALAGNDTIRDSGDNVSIDAGDGSNLIDISGKNEVILLKGRTTVAGFNTGFGDGSDTIYIKPENDPAGVEFLDDGLTFGNDTASLTLSDVKTTAKVNLFHENRDVLNKGVFIAPGDWYKVKDSDLIVDVGEEVYFVGTAATPKAGVDFSGINADLNLTIDTAYIDSEEYVSGTTMWINGVYSLKGGAGNTTITGSANSDTIISGTGATTINAATGDDLISLSGSSSALITYAEGDGNDTVYGFSATDTLSVDSTYKIQVSGNDLIVTVGDGKITLVDAAKLSYPNIESSNPLVQVVEAILKRTAAGYPVIAGIVFNPEDITGPEPDNYAAKEAWTIKSADNLELYGVHYTPENSNDKWVVLVHGYGLQYESMNPFATFYLANNYNVLMIDQRAAGKSEGTWLTMGVAESQDVALWTQEIVRRNSNAKITLHGVSMGAATAMLAAARSDTKNVTSIVEDCGYSDVMATFSVIVANHPELSALGISAELIPLIDPVAESLTGYYLHDAAPINSISSVKLPTLFISGDDDGVAPVSMLSELYDASGADVKEKFVVKGAGHAQAGLSDPLGYSNAVFRFVAEADGEGWATENVADNISLRGTKYNDTLANSGDYVTINAGAGDDIVSLDAQSNVIVYADGDGFDIVEGLDSTDTISITGAAYTSMTSGDDIILTIGDGNVTLADAADLETVNVIGTLGSGGVDINNTLDATLLTGTEYADSITNTGTRVTVQALGGDDYIANVVDSSVTTASLGNSINAGDGNDTIFNYHTYNPTLEGGAGNDSIVVSNGHLTYIDGGAGADTIIGLSESIESDDWAMGGHATILGGAGDDYIAPFYSNDSSINGGSGNDTIIINGANTTIDGGTGNNLIRLTTDEEGATAQYIVMNGNTTVEGFGTGFDSTSDTIYVAGDAPNVDFKTGGLTFYSGDKSLTLSDVTTTAQVNLYYAAWDYLEQGVYIADDDWYSVTDSELNTTENLHYVGATAKVNHGLNFSAVTGNLNMTLDTDYNPGHDFYVNNVYSIRGGAGNTTITGSAKSDTILAGTGSTTINAGAGGDILSGNGNTTFNIDSGATTTVNGAAGDSLNVADEDLIFISDGTVYIVDGTIKSISDNTALETADGDLITGSGLEHATIVDGASVSLTSDDKEIFVTKNGASITGYTLDKAFISNEADAATIVDLINATDSSQLILDSGTFYGKGQSPVVLEDYDTSNGTFVNIKTADGRKTIFGWSPLNGGIVDGNDIDKPQVIFGDAPNGNSIIRGGALNDTIFAGVRDIVSLSGGHDDLYINDETAQGVTVDMGDGSANARTRIVDGFDVTRDLLKIDSPENINARILDGSLQFIKGDSRVTFDELATFDDANGLQVQIDGRTYELRNDYDSGLANVDYLWTDTDGNYYITDSTFRIFDDGSTREYFIGEGSGRRTIDGFNFGRDNDKLNLTTIDGLTTYGDNLYVESGDSDIVEVTGGAGKTIDIKLDGTTYTAQLGKHLTYDLDAEYYGDLHGGTGCAISVAANFAQESIAIYLNEEEEADGKIRYYGGVTKIDASAFTGQASLVGSEFNDQIIASRGATSLWGGESGDDELFGTGSDNSFFYCMGNGDDKIYNAADGDAVNLVDIRLEDITNSAISAEAVTLELSDGGCLTVMNSADVTFNLGDGTSWKADRQSKEWQQQA